MNLIKHRSLSSQRTDMVKLPQLMSSHYSPIPGTRRSAIGYFPDYRHRRCRYVW